MITELKLPQNPYYSGLLQMMRYSIDGSALEINQFIIVTYSCEVNIPYQSNLFMWSEHPLVTGLFLFHYPSLQSVKCF